jgi:hypothetical protein
MRFEFRRKVDELNTLMGDRVTDRITTCKLIESSSEPLCGLRCEILEDGVVVRETGLEGVNRRIVAMRGRRGSGSVKSVSPGESSVPLEEIERFNLDTVLLIAKLKSQVAVMR